MLIFSKVIINLSLSSQIKIKIMGAFIALLIGIVVFAMLVHSGEGIKKEPRNEDKENGEKK